MNISFEKRLLLSLSAIGILILFGYTNGHSELGFLIAQLAVGCLLYMPFCNYKYSLVIVGAILILWNIYLNYLPNLPLTHCRLYASIAVFIIGLIQMLRLRNKAANPK